MPAIDVRAWARRGCLTEGHVYSDRWAWRVSGKVAIARYVVESACLRVTLTVTRLSCPPLETDQRINLDTTPCTYGGARAWWVCPSCRRRAAVLYLGDDSRFACRRCLRLAYPSQNESPHERALSRAQRIRSHLGGERAIGSPFPAKPRGMHWRNYSRLYIEVQRAEAAYTAWLGSSLGLWPRGGPE